MPMAFIEWGVWRPDASGQHPGSCLTAQNVVHAPDGYKLCSGLGTPGASALATASRCQGAASFTDDGGADHWFAGDAADLYHATAGAFLSATWTVVSATTNAYDVGTDDFWEFVVFNNKCLAAGNASASGTPVQFYDMATAVPFADLGNAPHAKHIAVVRDFVVVGNTYDSSDGMKQNRVRWCAKGDETSWTVSAATQADKEDLPDGTVVHRIIGGEYGLIFTNHSVYRMTYEGSPTIFRLDRIVQGIGTFAPQSAIAVGEDVYFYSTQGWAVIRQGAAFERIGAGKVDRYTLNMISQEIYAWDAIYDRSTHCIMWRVPLTNNPGAYAQALVYSLTTGEWTRAHYNNGTDSFLINYWFNGNDGEKFKSDTETGRTVGWYIDNANKLSRVGSEVNQLNEPKLVSREFEVEPGRRAMLTGISPDVVTFQDVGFAGESVTTHQSDGLEAKVHYRESLMATAQSTAAITQYAQSGHATGMDIPVRVHSRFFRVELGNDSGNWITTGGTFDTFTTRGFYCEYKPMGRR